MLFVTTKAPTGPVSATSVQTDDAAFTRYDLLAPASHALRSRIDTTYENAKGHHADSDGIVFNRSLEIKRNIVVLPAGQELTNSTIPATIDLLPDGRIRLDFIDPRPDEIVVVIMERRAP